MDLLDLVARMGQTPMLVDAGLSVQPMTTELAAATGLASGVIVAGVEAGSPAATILQPGDVITSLDGDAVDGPDSLLLDLGVRLATGKAAVTYVRNGQSRTGEIGPLPADREGTLSSLTLNAVPGQGTRVGAIAFGTPFHAAGLAVDDLIVKVGAVTAPGPAEVRRQLAATPRGEYLLLVVRRGDTQRVVAVQPRPDRDGRDSTR
jgi:S1-C subfamily serine protease